MADMTTHLMLDDVNLTILGAHAGPADALAGYVNGTWANWNELVATYKSSGKHLLSIDVRNDPAAGAQILDIESGDAAIGDAPGWYARTKSAGEAAKDDRYYPKLYTSAGNVQALINAMTQAGVARHEYLIWSAHYTEHPHICSPSACGYPQADATQWTSTYMGVSLDASLVYGYFFAGSPEPPAPPPPPKPAFPVPGAFKVAPVTFELTWDAVPNAEAYHVEVADAAGKVLFDVSPTTNSATFGPVPASTEYQARIATHATATVEASHWSPFIKFTV
jgi:hypothetical protein